MGVFNKINEKSGVIVTIIIIALVLLIVGGDLMGPNSFFKSGNQNVGEIAGSDISDEEYKIEVENRRNEFTSQSGKNPTEGEMANIYNQAWNELVYKYAYEKQYKKLGLAVSEEEVEEMISGKNLHEGIVQAPIFKNEMTQQFDRAKFNEWKANLEKNEQGQMMWQGYVNSLPMARLREKYFNLFKNGVYVTKEEAKKEYSAQNSKAEVKYLYVPYYAIPDSTFKITDDQIADYVDDHKKEFKVEAGRSIEYVLFSIAPSAEDSIRTKTELADLKKEFADTEEDSIFAASNSDVPSAASVMRLGDLPESLKSRLDSLKKGEVYGPYQDKAQTYGPTNGAEAAKFKLYKITDIIEDPKDSMYYASARHILFMTKDKTAQQKDSIKKIANGVLEKLKKGEDFESMVLKYSEDPGSKATGGEYKWFPKGQMVKPFDEAVFTAKSKGLIPRLVETEYGYHILKVTDTKSNKKFKVATIEKDLLPIRGGELAYQKASTFASSVKDTASFRAQAKKDALMLQSFKNMKKNEQYVNTLMSPRELIRWAYGDADVEDVSPVYTSGENYVVAVLTGAREEGTAGVEDAREQATPKIMAELKSAQIIEKLKKITANDLDAKASQYGMPATSGTAQNVTIASGSMEGVGFDPEIVGTVFGLVPGKRTVPLKGENGVVILELVKIVEAPEIADYATFKSQLIQQKSANIMNEVDKAVRDDAEIKDERVKFY